MSDEEGEHGFWDLVSEVSEASSFAWEEEEAEEEGGLTVLSFRVGEDLYCVEGSAVREVLGEAVMTTLPGAPEYLPGITMLRRQAVGLLALERFLERGDGEERDWGQARILVVETAHYVVGLLVDEVTGLETWPERALGTLPENLNARTRRFARGGREVGESLRVLLDLEELLDEAALR